MAGPVAAAIGDPDVAPAFPPLPSQSRVTDEQLRAGGGRGELFAVYAGIASGRMVVVGPPGAGKSGTAVLLLLDALAHRDHVEDKDRARVPVPVKVTPHDWDPTACSAQDWLAARLAADYPMFQHRGGHAEAAALVAAGAVTLILDGFDEMDVARRSAALQALNDATFRIVVLTRGNEMAQAAGATWLVEAVALHLDPVGGTEGADYLQRACIGPPPLGWTQLLAHLRQNPDSALTSGLSTPLTLTLIRDTYRPGDDVSALLSAHHGSTDDDIEKQLIDRVLPDAYKPRPGRSKPRYSLTPAEQVLAFLARQMRHDDTRDLAWWNIPRWAPSTLRILISTLVVGLAGGLLGVLILGPVNAIGSGTKDEFLAEFVGGSAFGLGVGIGVGVAYSRGGLEPKRIRTWGAIRLWSVVTAALGYGVVILVAGITAGITAGVAALFVLSHGRNPELVPDEQLMPVGIITIYLAYGLMVGLPFMVKRDVVGGLGERDDSRHGPLKSRRNRRVLGVLVLVAALGVLVVVLMSFTVFLVVGLLVVGLLVIGLVYWLARLAARFPRRLVVRLAENARNPQDPSKSWRNDRVFRLALGLVLGLAVGLPIGVFVGWDGVKNYGVVTGVIVGLATIVAYCLLVGLVYGLGSSVTWSTTLAWFQLRWSGDVPAVGLMSFLEDARSRDVLRADGAVYQFRHATLQDHLAVQTPVVTQPLRHREAAERPSERGKPRPAGRPR